jgi:hypothetical protein
MQAVLDLPAVRRFTDEMNDRVRRGDNGEGVVRSDLDESIRFHVQLCDEFRTFVDEWALAVFSGRIAFDREVEDLLKREASHLLRRAESVAVRGRAKAEVHYEFAELDALHGRIAGLDYLLKNWVSPQLAVGPAPRVHVPDAAAAQISERLEKLPPLPAGWRPNDPQHQAIFEKQRRGQ